MRGKSGILPCDLASFSIGRDGGEIFIADRLVMLGNPSLSERSEWRLSLCIYRSVWLGTKTYRAAYFRFNLAREPIVFPNHYFLTIANLPSSLFAQFPLHLECFSCIAWLVPLLIIKESTPRVVSSFKNLLNQGSLLNDKSPALFA